MKKLLFCAAALLAAASCASCSDSEDNTVSDDDMVASHNIIGTWQIVHAEGWEIKNGEKFTWSQDYPSKEDYDEYWTYTFDKEGNYEHTSYNMNGVFLGTDYHTYTLSGRTLTLYDGDEIPEVYRITTLNNSQLDILHKGEDSNSSWELTQTYERVK